MNIRRALTLGAALVVLGAPGAFAQSSNPAPDKPTIRQRKENQQARIAQGVKSGQLTPRETSKLERQQRSINHEERNMRKADNGHLTKADRQALNRRQNRASRNIYDKKHNAKKGY
ncbi:MAG TPA: hypothetical protein VMF66_05150 [Candidatus Acidoferrum sp.]|nr:hypothetical protein [Candidatus Acidoferrum sp.]